MAVTNLILEIPEQEATARVERAMHTLGSRPGVAGTAFRCTCSHLLLFYYDPMRETGKDILAAVKREGLPARFIGR